MKYTLAVLTLAAVIVFAVMEAGMTPSSALSAQTPTAAAYPGPGATGAGSPLLAPPTPLLSSNAAAYPAPLINTAVPLAPQVATVVATASLSSTSIPTAAATPLGYAPPLATAGASQPAPTPQAHQGASAQNSLSASTDPVRGYWQFNGDLNDSSIYHNNGIDYPPPNAATYTQGISRLGLVRTFSTLPIQLTNNGNSLVVTDTISLEAWVNSPDYGTGWRHIIDNTDGYALSIYQGELAMLGPNGWWLPSIPPLTLNQWHYVVGTYDSASGYQALYVDGQMVFNRYNAVGTLIWPGSGQVAIGGWGKLGPDYLFNGTLDEVRMTNRALSAAEIAANYTGSSFDPGNKGLNLTPYEWSGNAYVPVIRPGGPAVLNDLVAADVRWVRLEFQQQGGNVNLQDYDWMVNQLRAAGISVLGLVDYQTLVRNDFNNPTTAATYRLEFSNMAKDLASYFRGRIDYWEVWNEESNPEPGPYMTWISPELYAPLLNDTYTSIKQANPNAVVLFGGLNDAFHDSEGYFVQVYGNWGPNQTVPFDILALHPYFSTNLSLDPQSYLHEGTQKYPGDKTILDKYISVMDSKSGPRKNIWVTEIGWNSSLDEPDRGGCLANVAISQLVQAIYLKSSFDILFNEAPRVQTTFWYQYIDVGYSCPSQSVQVSGTDNGMSWQAMKVAASRPGPLAAQGTDTLSAYGLYHIDHGGPKLSQCAFRLYPQACIHFGFLPLVDR